MYLPERRQCTTEAQGKLVARPIRALLQQPGERCAQVIMLPLESLEPADLLEATQFRLGPLCQRQLVRSVSFARSLHFSA